MKTCILIAGLPASGKTSFACHLAEQLRLPMVSKDRIKELLYNSLGFRSSAEKAALGGVSMDILYYFAEALMQTGQPFILENNFENRSKPQLQQLLQQYPYRVVTVRFGGDVRVIYQRFLQRNTDPARHRGHVVSAQYPPQPAAHILENPMTFEDFVASVEQRGIREFTFGNHEIYVDATDFEQVRYQDIIQKIRQCIGEAPLW